MLTQRAKGRRPVGQQTTGAEIGRLVIVDEAGVPWVDYPSAPGAPARAALAAPPPTGAIEAAVGRHVALVFEGGDPARPIIVGWIAEAREERVGAPRHLEIDGASVVVEGTRQVELRCGRASITLTADGKLILKGVQVTSDAERLNRIRGSAVRIN